MEIAGFVVALVALVVSIVLGFHSLVVGPKLKAESAIRYVSDGEAWHVTGVAITIYNLGGSALPVQGVGVGHDGDPRSLSWADPGATQNPSFPLSLAPGESVNVLLVQDLEPGQFLRVRYFARIWGMGPFRSATWQKPVTEEMVVGRRVDSEMAM